MSVLFRTNTYGTSNGFDVTLTLAAPAPQDGDLMYAAILVFTDFSVGTYTLTASGWTGDPGPIGVANNQILWIFSRTAGSSEPPSYVWTYTPSGGAPSETVMLGMIVDYFSNDGAVSQVDVEAAGLLGPTNAVQAPYAALDGPQNLVMGIFANGAGDITATPPGTTERSAVGNLIIMDYTAAQSGGSASAGTMASSVSSASWAAITVTLRTPPPLAPTLGPPGDNAYIDLAAEGVAFTETYNTGGASGGETAFHFTRTPSGSGPEWWNVAAGAWESEDVANASTSPLGSTVTFPAGAWADGIVCTWSMASEDANGMGPYASNFTVTGQQPASVVVNDPTGDQSTNTVTVSWTSTTHGTVTGVLVAVYTEEQYTTPGWGPFGGGPDVASATFTSDPGTTTLNIGSANAQQNLQAWVIVNQTSQNGIPNFIQFDLDVVTLEPPALSIESGFDANGIPVALLTLVGGDSSVPTLPVGHFQRSDDGGRTWTDVRAGPYYADPATEVIVGFDYEAVPNVFTAWRARIETQTTPVTLSAWTTNGVSPGYVSEPIAPIGPLPEGNASAGTYTNWSYGTNLASILATLTIYQDPGPGSNIFCQCYDGAIDGTASYVGVQSDGSFGRGGILFARFGVQDTANVRVGGSNGIGTAGTSSGENATTLSYGVGSFPAGTWLINVLRNDFDSGAGTHGSDWFELYVTPPVGGTLHIGAIRFPRAASGVAATYGDNGGSWLEHFTGDPCPNFHCSYQMSGQGPSETGDIVPQNAWSTYGSQIFLTSPGFNNDVTADPTTGIVTMSIGAGQSRQHSSGYLFWNLGMWGKLQTTQWDVLSIAAYVTGGVANQSVSGETYATENIQTTGEATDALMLHRVQLTGLSTADEGTPQMGDLETSIVMDREEPQGAFTCLGRSTYVVVRGTLLEEEFDIGLGFYADEDWAWEAFDALRSQQVTVLLRGDQPGQRYYANLGAARQVEIMRASDRTVSPTRALSIHCYPAEVP